MPRYEIVHTSCFALDATVRGAELVTRLEPPSTALQRCLTHELRLRPRPTRREQSRDAQDNPCCRLGFDEPLARLELTAVSRVERTGLSPAATLAWEDAASRDGAPSDALAAYASEASAPDALVASKVMATDAFAAYAAPSFRPRRPLGEAVADLSARIHRDFRYDERAVGDHPPARVLERRRGVCQDFARVTLACLRALGLEAHYVAGYVARRGGKHASRGMHAWASVRLPDGGWLDVDPTLGALCDSRHVTVARGPDPAALGPIDGRFAARVGQALRVDVTVTELAAAGHGA